MIVIAASGTICQPCLLSPRAAHFGHAIARGGVSAPPAAMFASFGGGDDAAPAWRERLRRHAWGISTAALALFGSGLVYATVAEVARLTHVVAPTPPEVTTDVVTEAADRLGRRASFRILLFTDEFRWRLNSHDALDASPARPAFTPEMKAVLNDAQEIITVGASSEEIPDGISFEAGRRFEEQRAARRAERIALWVREAVSKPVPIRKLNVGHHAATGRPGDTSDQRRVVISRVLEQDEGADLDQALRAAMAGESLRAPVFEALLTRYSLSAGRSFTWVP
jgi:hypothetical protein